MNIEEPLVRKHTAREYKNNCTHPKKILCFKREAEWFEMPDRMIFSNVIDAKLPNNKIETSKYNFVTFLPKNLFEQFRKLANLYFLLIGVLQMVKEISTSAGQPVIYLPLFVILLITAIKDLFEDLKRHKSDREENSKKTLVLRPDGWQETEWSKVRVGDLLKICQKEYFPADLMVISTTDENGLCYVETKNLDGETNLKHKSIPKELRFINELPPAELHTLRLQINYEKPNPYLYTFTGSLKSHDQSIYIPMDNQTFALRGCSLQNTKYVIGIVCYTGHETKIMLNSVRAKAKFSSVETLMNRQILVIFGMQICFCFFSAFYAVIWYKEKQNDAAYLEISPATNTEDNFALSLFVRFGNWLILFTNFVPISLLVTLEMVKFIQGIVIFYDKKLFYAPNQMPTTVQSSNLNEELGQIQFIFSDKTGTLTKNFMEFKKMSVDGISFGDDESLINKVDDFPKVTNVSFYDANFFNCLSDENNPQYNTASECLVLLALCHNIIIEEKPDGEKQYNASSPDELALVNFAKYAGCQYVGKDGDNVITVSFKSRLLRYRLLQTLEFTSLRKRMSVVVQDDRGNIILYTKGADSIIEDRLHQKGDMVFLKTWSNLEGYASKGLRTLVLAKKKLSQEEYDKWAKEYADVSVLIENRDEKIYQKQEELERGLELVGATAIEDKLQDDVAETISVLQQTGIKIFMLTGDKVETAINIAYSCKLINDSFEQILIDGKDEVSVGQQLTHAEAIIKEKASNNNLYLVVTGDALIFAAKPQKTQSFSRVANACKSIIASRVSPKQKQEIVAIMRKEKPNAATLAIGDGANDVNMITAANVGVGIRGVEGQQAARASDYAIGEFRLLRRLLLYHGRESYRRNSALICYNFFKNMLLVLPNFWFAFLNGFSGVTIFDPWIFQLFNLFYASLPIFVYAILDQEHSGNVLETSPHLYIQGIKSELFNKRTFWLWLIMGVWQAAVICLFSFYIMESNFIDTNGMSFHMFATGMIIFGAVVLNVNLKILLFSNTYGVVSLFFVFGSALFYLSNYVIVSEFIPNLDIQNSFYMLYNSGTFWILMILLVSSTTLIDLGFSRFINFLKITRENSDKKIIMIQHKKEETEKPFSHLNIQQELSDKNLISIVDGSHLDLDDFHPIKRKYTGYAYSQEDGAGPVGRHSVL